MYYQDISTSLVKKSLNNKGGIIQPHRLSPLGSQHYHNYFAASGQGAFERQGQIPIPVLRKVAEKAFLINICINHACRLASPFSRPITNKATKGFSISLKNTNSTITPQQQKKITMLENFFLNCGFNTDNERGSLLRFMKKGIRDLLTVDQITTEIQYRTDGTPFAFWTVDPATIYRHPQDTEDDDIDFIQLIDCVPVAEFTSKQLIFDTMNPRSDIEHSLYGYSYVEQAIELITGMINSFTYNQGNFINDNLPRGAILINGDPDQSSVDLISDYIINMMSDPSQKWRIPVFPSGDENGTIQWVSFQKGNRDMEFTEWTNRLWTSVAALFGTDLEELGIRVNTGTSVIPENPEARIKASKSRVLDDVLRFFQDHFQHILDLIDDNYCFEFIGAEQNDLKLQNECRTNKLSTCYTINEVRQEEGLEPINEEWANIPLNPQLIILHGQMQGEQQPKAESGLNDDDPDDDNPPPNRDDENDEEYKSKHEDTDINAEDVEKSIDTSKCHKEEITDKNGVRRNVWKKNAETESNSKKLLKENAKKDFNNIEQSLSNGIDFTVNNSKIGEILIEQGSTGKHGYGLKHIIEQRYKKDGKSEDEITALLSLIVEAARNGEIVRNNEIIQNGKDIGTYYLEKNGIIAFVSKNKNGTNTQFVITGFDDNEKKEEAADAIKTVIADNSYTQEFIIVKQQVGAVITSLNGTTDKTSVVGGEILNNTSTSVSSISKSIDKSTFTKLDYFKKQLIDVLVSQEKEENQNIEKAVKANIGEIRTRKDGFKYKKINNGKWKRIYESESKGAKLSIAAIKRKIDNAKDEEELMNIIMTNKQRFVDKMGFMLPIVQELNKYIDEKRANGSEITPAEQETEKKTQEVQETPEKETKPQEKKNTLTDKQKENLAIINNILSKNIAPMPERIDFTKENFNKLFKDGIDSPIEHIKIGENQFEKMKAKNRGELLATMADVMKDPALVIKTTTGEKIYAKKYDGLKQDKNIISVIIDKEDLHINISTHIKRDNQLAKKTDSILYERTESIAREETPPEAESLKETTLPQDTEKSSLADIKAKENKTEQNVKNNEWDNAYSKNIGGKHFVYTGNNELYPFSFKSKKEATDFINIKRLIQNEKNKLGEAGYSKLLDKVNGISNDDNSTENDNAKKEFTEKDKKEVLNLLQNPTDEMLKVEYTRDNYNKLFPEGKVKTPIGEVKLGEHQFERLGVKDDGARKNLLGAMYQTLKSPTVIIDELDKENREAKIYIKTFKEESGTIAIVVDKDGENISVSFGKRKEKQIENKIKMASIFYYKAEGGSPTIGTGLNPLPNSENISQEETSVNNEALLSHKQKNAVPEQINKSISALAKTKKRTARIIIEV